MQGWLRSCFEPLSYLYKLGNEDLISFANPSTWAKTVKILGLALSGHQSPSSSTGYNWMVSPYHLFNAVPNRISPHLDLSSLGCQQARIRNRYRKINRIDSAQSIVCNRSLRQRWKPEGTSAIGQTGQANAGRRPVWDGDH